MATFVIIGKRRYRLEMGARELKEVLRAIEAYRDTLLTSASNKGYQFTDQEIAEATKSLETFELFYNGLFRNKRILDTYTEQNLPIPSGETYREQLSELASRRHLEIMLDQDAKQKHLAELANLPSPERTLVDEAARQAYIDSYITKPATPEEAAAIDQENSELDEEDIYS